MEDIFDFLDTEPESGETVRITLPKKVSRELRRRGIRDICFIDYNEAFGPYLRFYINKRSKIFSEITKNPAFLPDLMLLARDTKEFLLRDERTLVIFDTLDEKITRVILIETTKEFHDHAFNILSRLISKLREEKQISEDNFIHAIENAVGVEQ